MLRKAFAERLMKRFVLIREDYFYLFTTMPRPHTKQFLNRDIPSQEIPLFFPAFLLLVQHNSC